MKLILIICIPILLLVVRLIAEWQSVITPAEISIIQYYTFLPVAFFLFFASSTLRRVLQVAIPSVSVLVLTTAFLTFTHSDLKQGAFLLGKFEGDFLEDRTVVFRDRIREVVGWKGVTALEIHGAAISHTETARKLLNTYKNISGVIWGSERWLTLELRDVQSIELKEWLPSDSLIKGRPLEKLRILTAVSQIGLSSASEYPTVDFLGRLIQVWQPFQDSIRTNSKEAEALPDHQMLEGELRSLAAVKGVWTSNSHRALPIWMVGVVHLQKAVSNSQIELGELLCAEQAFEAASAQLRPWDSIELQASVKTGIAVALAIRSTISVHKGVTRKAALLQFKAAKKLVTKDALLKQSNLEKVVTSNLALFVDNSGATRSKRSRKNK